MREISIEIGSPRLPTVRFVRQPAQQMGLASPGIALHKQSVASSSSRSNDADSPVAVQPISMATVIF